jgi:hypothetical protein
MKCPATHPNGNPCALENGHAGNHVQAGHHCHARGCATATKPEMLMCARHWYMVPLPIRKMVWAEYRNGQCDDKQPSEEWHKAADLAIKAVWEKEMK